MEDLTREERLARWQEQEDRNAALHELRGEIARQLWEARTSWFEKNILGYKFRWRAYRRRPMPDDWTPPKPPNPDPGRGPDSGGGSGRGEDSPDGGEDDGGPQAAGFGGILTALSEVTNHVWGVALGALTAWCVNYGVTRVLPAYVAEIGAFAGPLGAVAGGTLGFVVAVIVDEAINE